MAKSCMLAEGTRKAGDWRGEQAKIRANIAEHEGANQSYLEEGILILELARKPQGLFLKQVPQEKRRLLNFVLSNCSWKDGALTANWRKPFDILASGVLADQSSGVAGGSSTAKKENWLPTPYAARTLAVPIQLASWLLSRQPREPQERRPCSGPGCNRTVYARGLCVNHYKRWSKGTWVPPVEPVRVRQRRVRVG